MTAALGSAAPQAASSSLEPSPASARSAVSVVSRAAGWPGRLVDRIHFERGARAAYPDLHGRSTDGSAGFRYVATVDVPFYEARVVTIIFQRRARVPIVLADGPKNSPHRYGDGGLCMWFPDDPRSMRWHFSHGLLDLLDSVRAHLFREAWWREHAEWLGPEVSHGFFPSEDREIA